MAQMLTYASASLGRAGVRYARSPPARTAAVSCSVAARGEAKPAPAATLRRHLLAAAVLAATGLPLAARADDLERMLVVELMTEREEAEEAKAPPEPELPGTFVTYSELTLAYAFESPLRAADRKLNWVISRQPEKYSSAAPLSADARQRIVFEQVDFSGPFTLTVVCGPYAPGLVSKSPASWTAQQVAEAVLADRSTGRVTGGQRILLSSVEAATTVVHEGRPYYVYETLSQGSPTIASLEAANYRHALAVSTERDGYIYTFSLTAPDALWATVGPAFRYSVDSFRLATPAEGYIAPGENPFMIF